jgi:hypothetical protein
VVEVICFTSVLGCPGKIFGGNIGPERLPKSILGGVWNAFGGELGQVGESCASGKSLGLIRGRF